MDLKQQSQFLEHAIPEKGLFAEKEWRQAVRPFPLSSRLVKELENLGRILLKFYQATSELYRFSHQGREPSWVHEWLDLGKPDDLVELQSHRNMAREIPRVIRPDVLLTEDGLAITELDSVPGGIGLTAWLNRCYQQLGFEVIGGADGMVHGFAGIFPDSGNVHILVSEESKTYRPEMEWLASTVRELWPSRDISVRDADFAGISPGDSVYRFFELFDLANIPAAPDILSRATGREIFLTPPPKAFLEEKMTSALLWNRNLEEFWIRELGRSYFDKLLKVIPRTWVVDPSPIPPHAAIPGLEITNWNQLKTFSQKRRNLILKVSGFSENAWGARGVHLGSDMPSDEWGSHIDAALKHFNRSPHVLQQFHKPASVDTAWISRDGYVEIHMKARVRLCPYYFVHGQGNNLRASLQGVLATLCPADKKIIHGMSEAVLAPCCVSD